MCIRGEAKGDWSFCRPRESQESNNNPVTEGISQYLCTTIMVLLNKVTGPQVRTSVLNNTIDCFRFPY